jgi:hypothetical protein
MSTSKHTKSAIELWKESLKEAGGGDCDDGDCDDGDDVDVDVDVDVEQDEVEIEVDHTSHANAVRSVAAAAAAAPGPAVTSPHVTTAATSTMRSVTQSSGTPGPAPAAAVARRATATSSSSSSTSLTAAGRPLDNKPWMEMLRQLSAFHDHYGHCVVKRTTHGQYTNYGDGSQHRNGHNVHNMHNYNNDNYPPYSEDVPKRAWNRQPATDSTAVVAQAASPKLANWVHFQRKSYNKSLRNQAQMALTQDANATNSKANATPSKGKKSKQKPLYTYPPRRKQLLDELGFDWGMRQCKPFKFEQGLAATRAYQETHNGALPTDNVVAAVTNTVTAVTNTNTDHTATTNTDTEIGNGDPQREETNNHNPCTDQPNATPCTDQPKDKPDIDKPPQDKNKERIHLERWVRYVRRKGYDVLRGKSTHFNKAQIDALVEVGIVTVSCYI